MQKYILSSLLPTSLLRFFVISFFIFLAGCTGSKDMDGTSFVIGQIQMVSNEPFANLALINDASLYLLDCNEDVYKMLYNNQGKSVKIYYSSMYKNDEGLKVLKTINAEILTGPESN
jgi:uncharacterized protein YcfL